MSDRPAQHELTVDQRRLVETVGGGEPTPLLVVAPPGTGKTYALTAMVVELVTRMPDARVLVMAPGALLAHLEVVLEDRLGSSARITRVSGPVYLGLRQEFGDGEWQPGVYVVSLDLAKRHDVSATLGASAWDLVAIDEAHALAGRRATLATTLAGSPKVRSLVLLSASPLKREPFAELVQTVRWEHANGGPAKRTREVITYHRTPGEQKLYLRLRQFLDEQATDKRVLTALESAWRSSLSALEWVLIRERSKLKIDRHLEWPTLFDPLVLGEPLLGESGTEQAAWADPAAAAAEIDEILRHISHVDVDSKLEAALAAVEHRRQEGQHLPCVITSMRETATYIGDALESRQMPAPWERPLTQGDEIEVGGGVVVTTDAGLQGLELVTDTLLSYELPRSRLRIEQRWGRVDRVGRVAPVTMFALRDLSAVDPVEGELLSRHGFGSE